MAAYKLRVPEAGTWLYGDGPSALVADTIKEAREEYGCFEVHAVIGRCRVLYAHDIEAGDCFEGAERGDTMVMYGELDDGRALGPAECRVWIKGIPGASCSMQPLPFEPVHPRDVPVGCSIGLPGPRSSRTVGVPRETPQGKWVVEVAIFPEFAERLTVCLTDDDVHIMPTGDWPSVNYRLTVEGETAEGSEDEMEALRRWACAAYEEEWRRNLYATDAVGGR